MLFTSLKPKTTGHGGEVYKGLLPKSKGHLSYFMVRLFMPKNFQQRIKVLLHFGIRVGFSFKKKMASLETNVSVNLEMEIMLKNSVTIQNLILEMEELKRAMKRIEVKLAILEAIVQEPMKFKPTNPEKFKERGCVCIQAWLGVMKNYLHATNTSPNFWFDISQTYLEIRVAQNWHNMMNILEREREGKNVD